MSKPFVYFDKLTTWDKISIGIYIVLTAFFWYIFDKLTTKNQRELIYVYGLGTQMFLYFFNYRSLRNFTVYLFWILVGVLHFCIYIQLKDSISLMDYRSHSTTIFKNTIPLLVLYQILRFLSFTAQNQEFVMPCKGSKTDFFDERK